MYAFLVGWGVFWLLIWSGLFTLSALSGKTSEDSVLPFLGLSVAVSYMVAVIVAGFF